mgnify:CR=1 FL=1|jgi:heavy metal translocating P-type ATPase
MKWMAKIRNVLADEASRAVVFCAMSLPALAWSLLRHGGHARAVHGLTLASLSDPAWIAIILCGLPIIVFAFRRFLETGSIRAGMLVSVAMLGAVGIGEIFAAGEVAFIMTLGEILEARALRKARAGIKALLHLVPKQACRIRDGVEEMVEVDSLVQGDVIRVRPGEMIAVDGVVLDGNTSVDQAIITGESLPVDKVAGDNVMSGTINRFGSMDVCTVKAPVTSTLKRITRLIETAQNNKAPVVRLADKWASFLVPTAFVTALAIWLVTGELIRGVTILVVFCPCALVLATPTAIMAGMANLSRYGVLVKSGEAIEAMGRIATIAFDKTGTLTYGEPSVTNVVAATPEYPPDVLLRLAAGAEARSEHPLGKAIASAVADAPSPAFFKMMPGRGVEADVAGMKIALGTLAWLKSRGTAVAEKARKQIEEAHAAGQAIVAAEIDGSFAGWIALSDTLREDARSIIDALRHSGIRKILLLTGDHAAAAHRMASEAGIDDVQANLLPEDKASLVLSRVNRNEAIAMVGDGINDAAALKTATVGIAMGGIGSDITMEAADIVLMRDDIKLLPYLVVMSRRTLANIRMNIGASLLVNSCAILLAATGRLGPAAGALVHNAGSLFVVIHAAMLLRCKPSESEWQIVNN